MLLHWVGVFWSGLLVWFLKIWLKY
uniref:Uncharacterized protein n=1 Tax=Anguilla anguilla TaxID=7936 RepID=A0A0E9W8Q0_ANGAN